MQSITKQTNTSKFKAKYGRRQLGLFNTKKEAQAAIDKLLKKLGLYKEPKKVSKPSKPKKEVKEVKELDI